MKSMMPHTVGISSWVTMAISATLSHHVLRYDSTVRRERERRNGAQMSGRAATGGHRRHELGVDSLTVPSWRAAGPAGDSGLREQRWQQRVAECRGVEAQGR